MDISSANNFRFAKTLKINFIGITIVFCIILTITLDAVESSFHNYSFYLSESLLFSSFWWLFLPVLYAQYLFCHHVSKKYQYAPAILLFSVTHLVLYSAIVLTISALFFEKTFPFTQTLYYGLTEYGFVLLISYTLSFFALIKFQTKNSQPKTSTNRLNNFTTKSFVQSLSITDGDRHLTIQTKDIQFIMANSPYVTIHHLEKRYLYNETLKSISQKLDNNIFVRIHKSAIINLHYIQYYKSRLNGDYDLTMKDGSTLRLSRNFVVDFKTKFEKSPQDTTN
jgi:DNA-binding LytR/AlgR family response regulator